MRSFLITPIVDECGRRYWISSYPSRERSSHRMVRKFNTLERAESHLLEAKREWQQRGRIEFGNDSRFHSDALRAARVLSGVAHASLEAAAYVYLQCRSAKEKRGMGYEVPKDRRLGEVTPRIFLMVANEAKEKGLTITAAVESLLSEVAINRAQEKIREKTRTEKMEYMELKSRTDIEWKTLRVMRREEEINKAIGLEDLRFHQGRQSVLDRKAAYQRKWRARKKAGEVRNGN
jgi:hypothetical protein